MRYPFALSDLVVDRWRRVCNIRVFEPNGARLLSALLRQEAIGEDPPDVSTAVIAGANQEPATVHGEPRLLNEIFSILLTARGEVGGPEQLRRVLEDQAVELRVHVYLDDFRAPNAASAAESHIVRWLAGSVSLNEGARIRVDSVEVAIRVAIVVEREVVPSGPRVAVISLVELLVTGVASISVGTAFHGRERPPAREVQVHSVGLEFGAVPVAAPAIVRIRVRDTQAVVLPFGGVLAPPDSAVVATRLGQDPVTTMGYIKTKPVGGAAALAFETAW